MTSADKGGRGVWQMVTLADKGGGGAGQMVTSLTKMLKNGQNYRFIIGSL